MPCPESDAATYRRVRWGSAIQDDEGVTMDDLTLIFGTEVSGKITGRPSEQLGQLVRPVVDQPARDGTAGGVADVDRVATAEMALDGDNPRGKQRFTTCLLYTSPSPRDLTRTRLPSSALYHKNTQIVCRQDTDIIHSN